MKMTASTEDDFSVIDEDYDSFLVGRGLPAGDAMRGEIDDEDLDLQAHQGLAHMITSREGASFARLAKDVFLIPVFGGQFRSEEHTSELQSLMRISYAVFCLKKKKHQHHY